jgi:N-acetylneuraminic acid mutarotase
MKKIIVTMVISIPYISVSQNVGIGTNNPQQKLHVAGNVRVDAIAGTNGILKYDNNGDLAALPNSGNTNEVLLGNGAWGTLNGTVPAGTIVASDLINDVGLINKGFVLRGYIPGYTQIQSTSSLLAPVNSWQPTYLEGIPGKTPPPSFDGNDLFVWLDTVVYVFTDNSFYAYNPVSDQWRFVLTNPTSYKASSRAKLVWTGTEILVWGGNFSVATDNGFRYNPVSNVWTAIPVTAQPAARTGFAMEFISNKVIVWGGLSSGGTRLGDGAMFDLSSNTWTTINTTGAPSPRINFTSVVDASQNKMIIWGGRIGATTGSVTNDGAVFNPATNTWAAVTNTSAPSAREFHKAVWSGTEMLVFGGQEESLTSTPVNTGARYNPVANSWSAITTTSAPYLKMQAATWTGSFMLISGGNDNLYGVPNTPYSTQSYSYDPVANAWLYRGPTGVRKALHQMLKAGNIIVALGGGTNIVNPISDGFTNYIGFPNGSRYFLTPTVTNVTNISNATRLYLYIKN